MNEEEYEAARAAYEEALAQAREEAEEAARNAAIELAHEAARLAVEEARAEDSGALAEQQQAFEEQWTFFYKTWTDEANQALSDRGISVYCSDIEYGILDDIMNDVLGDEYGGGVEVVGTYIGYDDLYAEAYADAYSAALDELISNIEIDLDFEDFLEDFVDDDENEEEESNFTQDQLSTASENALNTVNDDYAHDEKACNIGLRLFYNELTCNTDLDGMLANELVEHWQDSDDWELIEMEDAQGLANDGVFVVAGAQEEGSESGHVIVIVPGEEAYSGSWGEDVPLGFDTGPSKKWKSKKISFSWGSDKKDDVEFYKYVGDTSCED
ncbi:hypothetical protein SAMN04488029_3523 [Reichenbachiella faecimaris]|uniref:Uncharacterized protein n=1 Tax=Reichenbachiella faecimaris TaxID=692418 RepID=A0A1W2GMJ9_REIFA|nr:hypothetical protein [Reichenbachiella faecimaris]SMD37889.1 hypothetical protein SAMN04488029_3523 [Reichenbachiella faecimaris]